MLLTMILLLSCVFVITNRRFGFTNLQAAKEGKHGVRCRGEEHEVVLIWSVVSGKTRVFWNKSNISHLFRERRNTAKVDLSWESRSGEHFRISAQELPTGCAPQYDFLIDGTSIFSLSHLSELTPSVPVDDAMDTQVRSDSVHDIVKGGTMEFENIPAQNLDFRLSMAGFTPCCESQDDLTDDLTPTSFTNMLESLRGVATKLIPNSEYMVSRAIINAFSVDQIESSSNSWEVSSSDETSTPTAIQIEADAILDTIEWINLNVQYAPRPDVEDQKRAFMQKQMESIFVDALQGRLAEDSAARMLSDIATLLGLTGNTAIPRDTLILNDLDKNTDTETILVALCVYGEIMEVGIATGHRGALCRFASESGPLRALAAAEQGSLSFHGVRPKVSLVEKSVPSHRLDLGRRAMSTPCEISHSIQKPNLGRRRSHQRNTLSIDTLISETPPFLRLVNDIAAVSPLDTDSFDQSGFDKISSSTQTSKLRSDLSAFHPDLPTVSPNSVRASAIGFS